MGRMLEALTKTRPEKPAEPVPQPVFSSPEPDEAPEVDDVPFIEVGERGKPPLGSPRVLAVPVRLVSPPLPEPPPAPRPVTLAFRPLAPELRPPGPAAARFAPELVAYHRPSDAVGTAYRDLWHALEDDAVEEGPRVLLFTAPREGTGTTTLVLNLGIAAAREGSRRLVVVDMDRQRPSLAERLGLLAAPGVAEVLAGSVTLDAALQETGQANLLALTAGQGTARGGPRLAGAAMIDLLARLRGRFDRVLLDGPPWDGRPEQVALGSYGDGVYLVLRETDENRSEIADLLRAMPRQGVALRGCVVAR